MFHQMSATFEDRHIQHTWDGAIDNIDDNRYGNSIQNVTRTKRIHAPNIVARFWILLV